MKHSESPLYAGLLDGQWHDPDPARLLPVIAAADDALLGYVPSMTAEQCDAAITSCARAKAAWAHLPVHERAAILIRAANLLDERADAIGEMMMKEIAKRRSSAIDEVKRTAELIRYTAEEGKRIFGQALQGDSFPGFNKNKLSIVTRVPLGVILAISPFNYPVNLAAAKIAPGLVTGNTVVFKPASKGVISALMMVRAFHDAGLPAGVLNTVTGAGSEIGDRLVQHPDISMLSFTGSSDTGRHIAQQAGMIPLIMELGGKDAAIILPDADLQLAAKEIVAGAFSYSGQRCTAVKRILVHESIADELLLRMIPLIHKLKVGQPKDNADITPLISTKSADYVESLIRDAVHHGAELRTGGQRYGRLLTPTLLDRVTLDMRIAWEEPFGPVLPVIRVQSVREAIDIANQSEYGLQSCVFTQDFEAAYRIAGQLEVGSVQINARTERGPDHFPFMGVKSSGMGTQGVSYSIQSMTRQKALIINLSDAIG